MKIIKKLYSLTIYSNIIILQAVSNRYRDAIEGPDLEIDFEAEAEKISLDIPKDGVKISDSHQWIVPLTPPSVSLHVYRHS